MDNKLSAYPPVVPGRTLGTPSKGVPGAFQWCCREPTSPGYPPPPNGPESTEPVGELGGRRTV